MRGRAHCRFGRVRPVAAQRVNSTPTPKTALVPSASGELHTCARDSEHPNQVADRLDARLTMGYLRDVCISVLSDMQSIGNLTTQPFRECVAEASQRVRK